MLPKRARRKERELARSSLSGEPDSALPGRNGLADQLIADGNITSPLVEAAFRSVPRHLFAPEVSADDAYANDIVRLKRDSHGKTISSVSAPWLQAVMLEQAGLGPGDAVCEPSSSRWPAPVRRDTRIIRQFRASGASPRDDGCLGK
jgi:hypothetical protein